MNSLQGLRVLNTRPLEQGKRLSQVITQAGGVALECPALTIVPTEPTWLGSLPDLQQVKQAIFISVNAAEFAFKQFHQAKLLWPDSIQVIAVGQATASVLTKYGLQANFPEIADSEHLLTMEILQSLKNKLILLFKGEGGRTLIAETLIARGANLVVLEVYRRLQPSLNTQELCSLWQNDAVDIILFTSQQAMQNIFAMFGEVARSWLCTKPCLVISERLAKEAAQLGMQTILVSAPDRIIATLNQFNQGLIHGQ